MQTAADNRQYSVMYTAADMYRGYTDQRLRGLGGNNKPLPQIKEDPRKAGLFISITRPPLKRSALPNPLSGIFHPCNLSGSITDSSADTKLIVGEGLHDSFFAFKVFETEAPPVEEVAHIFDE